MRIITRLVTRDSCRFDVDIREPVPSFGVDVANGRIGRAEVNSEAIGSSIHSGSEVNSTRRPVCELFFDRRRRTRLRYELSQPDGWGHHMGNCKDAHRQRDGQSGGKRRKSIGGICANDVAPDLATKCATKLASCVASCTTPDAAFGLVSKCATNAASDATMATQCALHRILNRLRGSASTPFYWFLCNWRMQIQ